MQDDKVDTINHAALVPQFVPRVPAYQADASHPLTEGYDLLARRISQAEAFREWQQGGPGGGR